MANLNNLAEPTTSQTNNENETEKVTLTEREAYLYSLNIWLQQSYIYYNMTSCFPYYLMSQRSTDGQATNSTYLNNNIHQYQEPILHQIPQNRRFHTNLTPAGNRVWPPDGTEYIIPPLWKRFMAELVDFGILFFLKLIVTLVVVEVFDIDLDKYDIDELAKNIQEDYLLAIEMTSEILFLEMIYRVFVCFYEAFCLSRDLYNFTTPGKAAMGLCVLNASTIVPVENRARDTVQLFPGTHLTFRTALCRALIKNILISLLFPLCFILFIFQHNRTGYDLICNVIVVENNNNPHRRNRP